MENDYYSDNTNYPKSSRPVLDLPGQRSLLDNLDVPGREVRILYVVGLFLAVLVAWVNYSIKVDEWDRSAFIPMVFSLMVLLVLWVIHKHAGRAPRNWLSPDVMFVAAFFTVHFTYIILYAFGVVPLDSEVFIAPSKVLRATFFCICCLSAFLIGYEVIGGLFRTKASAPKLMPVAPTVISISKFLIIVAIVFFWTTLFAHGLQRMLTDRQLLLNIGLKRGGRFYFVSRDIALVSIAIYCASSGLLHRTFMAGKVFWIFPFGYLLGLLAFGDRGGFVRIAPAPIIAFHYFQRRIKIRWVIAGTLVLFFVMGVLALTRDIVMLDIQKVTKVYIEERQTEGHNIITRTALEFGVSLKMVVAAMKFVPETHPYWYGKSYLDSLPIVVPNILPGPVRMPGGVDVWLNDVAFGHIRTHGRGGSIAMEAYTNFGFIGGLLVFVLLGGFYRSLYEMFLAKPGFTETVILMGATCGLMWWTRNTMSLYIRPLVWSTLAALILGRLFKLSDFESDNGEELYSDE